MRRILVVAHKTLCGDQLLEEVGRRMRAGECEVHLVVPVTHPLGAFSEASIHAEAERALEAGRRAIRDLDHTGAVKVTGEVGDSNPVYAVQCVLNRGERIDEIVVSTLPSGPSRWLLGGVPKRMAKAFPGIPVSHVFGDREHAPA